MEKQNETQMVYIKDLLFTVLYRWKAVLAVMAVFALLFGSAAMLLEDKPTQDELSALATYNTAKAVYDQRITALEKSVSQRRTYTENALLMTLDPYNHYEAQVTLSVQLPETTDGFQSAFSAQSLLEAYRVLVTEETCLTKLAETLQQPAQYVPELISSTVPAMGTDTVTFTVKCADAATAAALAETLESHLLQSREALSQQALPHSLTVVKSTGFAVSDSALAETQRGEINRLAEILTGLTEARNKRSALVRPDAADDSSKIKTTILLAAVGAFASAFLTVCLLWLGHIGSSKIYSARTLQNRTGIKVLGCLDSGKKRGPIQRRLRKLEDRSTSADPAFVATDIALRAEARKLLVTGCPALAQALKEALPQTEITSADLLESPDALKALAACDGVVLTATCGSSRYQAVLQQMEKVNDYNKQLIGCVLVDG